MHILMLCSFTNQVLAQLDLLRCGHELRPAGVHGWLQVALKPPCSSRHLGVPTGCSSRHLGVPTGSFNIITLDHLLKNHAIVGNSRRFWQSARLGLFRGLGLCAPMSCCQAARHVPRAFRACAADPLCTELCTRRSLLPQSLLTS